MNRIVYVVNSVRVNDWSADLTVIVSGDIPFHNLWGIVKFFLGGGGIVLVTYIVTKLIVFGCV